MSDPKKETEAATEKELAGKPGDEESGLKDLKAKKDPKGGMSNQGRDLIGDHFVGKRY